jgi:hypothetical protein
MLLLRWRRIK